MAAMLRIPEHLRRFCTGQSAVEVEGDGLAGILQTPVTSFPQVGCRALDASGKLRPHLVIFRDGRI